MYAFLIKGSVDAAPRLLDPKNQKSPPTFFVIEENPTHPEKPAHHEAREQLSIW